jgi:hypothetical protein
MAPVGSEIAAPRPTRLMVVPETTAATKRRFSPSTPYRWFVVVVVSSFAVVAGFSAAALTGQLGSPTVCACPAAWSVVYESHVHPGATGCQDLQGETCYAFLLDSNVAGFHLSGFRFELLAPPTMNTSPMSGAPIPLGPTADVYTLNAGGILVGLWNWASSNWIQGGDWVIPVATNVTLILDTGLQNAQLTGDYFWTLMAPPNHGAVGSTVQ